MNSMKKPRFKTLAIATLSAIALAASIVVAQTVSSGQANTQSTQRGFHDRGQRKGHGWGGMRGDAFRQLNLTEDQKAKIKQFRDTFAQTNKPLMDQLRSKRQELRQANEGGTFNEALATQKLTEMAGLEAKLMGERFKLHQETMSVLTAEQKTQLEQSRAQFKARRGEMRKGENE